MRRIVSLSAEETEAAGRGFAGSLRPGDVVALTGTLGSGKTRFVAGVCGGLGVRGHVTSPTFTLIHEYGPPGSVYHIDLYRLEEARQVATLGLEEIFDRDALVLIEWGERFPQLMPAERTEIYIRPRQNDEREIEVRQVT